MDHGEVSLLAGGDLRNSTKVVWLRGHELNAVLERRTSYRRLISPAVEARTARSATQERRRVTAEEHGYSLMIGKQQEELWR